MTKEEKKQFYQSILPFIKDENKKNRYYGLEVKSLGEGMILIEKSLFGWWKPLVLVDERAETATILMDENYILQFVSDKDIDWKSVKGLKGYWRVENHNARFPTHIGRFTDGIARVEWQVNPDGMYFRDEDGFGMTDDEEEALYAYIDRDANVLVPFTYVNDNPSRLEKLRKAALKKLSNKKKPGK